MTSENAPIDLEMLDTTFGKDGREDIISTFIEHSETLFSRMDPAFSQRDAEAVIDIAHQVKGMGASIYAIELSGKANQLEQLAKQPQPDWHEMSLSLGELRKTFADLSSYLEDKN